MDSRLLNVFHDDPFDGSYTQLNTDLWTNENDTMGQLTETLNGILPIAADVEHDTDVYSSTLLATEDNYRISHCVDATTNLQNKELLIYDDYTQHDLASDGSIEIITVNPNSLDSDDSDDEEDEDDDDCTDELNDATIEETKKHNLMGMEYIDYDDDIHSQYSNATFRTRTDSSSIGDYESHTSDYDDSSEEEDANEIASSVNNNTSHNIGNDNSRIDSLLLETDEMPDLAAGLLAADGIDLGAGYELPLEDIAVGVNKNRTLSTNTIGSELDVNNFDLAEFITNDDFTINVGKAERKSGERMEKPKINATVAKRTAAIPVKSVITDDSDSDSDADSDVIVDIETVDTDMGKGLWKMPKASVETTNENDISFEDNIEKDPSWSPKAAKKQQDNVVKEPKARPTAITTTTSNSPNPNNNAADISRNFSIVPSKRQCDILKGKSSATKNKLITKQIQGKPITKKGPETVAGNAAKAGSLTCRVGVGQGGKNLALVSENKNKEDESKQKSNQKDEKKLETTKCVKESMTTTQVAHVSQQENVKECELEQKKIAVKRKLNLEEYKQRRGENPSPGQNNGSKAETQSTSKSSPLQNTQVKHSVEVATVVKSLRNQITQKPVNDPITEAKNKVLRMQELKRAQQLKIIDSTISAKVPRVTKLPPLKEIVKDTCYVNNDEQKQEATNSKLHPDYEELIIVSAGSNTEISIPPNNILPINTCERSLLKSSAILYKLPNVLSPSSSLISSIQGVVVQKVIAPEKTGIANIAKASMPPKATQKRVEQHGEDKVIMHLRKDRIRPCAVSIGIQTDLQPGFEPLPKRISLKGGRAKRNYRKHNVNNNLDETDSDVSCDRGSRNQNRNRIRNCSRSRSRSPVNRSRSRSVDSYASSMERAGARQTDTTCGYSSRGTRRHRSSISSSYSESGRVSRNRQRQRRTSYTKRTKRYSRNLSSSSSSSSNRSRSRSRGRSRTRSHSRSRSRSRSPYYQRSYSRSRSRSRSISRASNNRFVKPGGYKKNANNVSQPAVEERRIVYVGRIEEETTKEMLRRKFLPYGTIKQISIHYKDNGMKYGFVTYERSQDAFTVIDGSARDPTINMYDISFGGRRAFCRSSYADLDNAGINTYHSIVFPKVEAPPKEEDSFEALLQKVKAKMNANKANTATNITKA